MDYHEFMEKANITITAEEYELVEKVYMNGPSEIIGSCVTEFCGWFNKSGKMKGVRNALPWCEAYGLLKEANRLNFCHYEQEKQKAEDFLTELNKRERQCHIYESIVSKEELAERLIAKMDRDDILKMLYEKEVQ